MRKQKSLRQLAGELGVSPSYLSMIRSGQRKCPSELIEKLQSIQGVHKVVNTCEQFEAAKLERETGLEPATACLEGRNSTTELLPQV